MEDAYESAQEAFLVGRYLKENGLSDTLECFLKETPIKMVPKMPENMQSLPQILRGFRSLLKDREELKEKRRRMQQYEEILNLLFEELRDVYDFQSPSTASTFTPLAELEQNSTSSSIDNDHNLMKVSTTTPEGQFISSDFDGNDAQLIEDFCLQNSNHRPTDNSGRVIPVVLPKRARQSNTSSSEGLRESVRDASGSRDSANRNPSNGRSERQPVYNRAQTLEHNYNRIREHRRLNGHSKHRILERSISPVSSFVAYSSLPVSSSKASASSCGHNGRRGIHEPIHKHGRSKKHRGADNGGQDSISACAALQSASCEESSNCKKWEVSCNRQPIGRERELTLKGSSSNLGFAEGLTQECHSKQRIDKDLDFDKGSTQECQINQSAEANLNQRVCSKGNDVNGCNAEIKVPSFLKFDQNKGRDSDDSAHQHEISWSITGDSPHHSITKPSSVLASCIDSAALDAAGSSIIDEGSQFLERRFQKHVSCGSGGLHYKAFLREKFFSTRHKQGTTIHKQELFIRHHKEQDCCSSSSSSSVELSHDEDSQRTWSCNEKHTNVKNGGEPVDPAVLASETANLLERLLPLVADSGSMESFISNIDSRTPRPSPRDLHAQNKRYWRHLSLQPQQADTSRSQNIDKQPSTSHESPHVDEIMKVANIEDDSSVLAELEEAVGQTVDEILRRYILVSPLPQPPADPH